MRSAKDPLWALSIVKSWKACAIEGASYELWGQQTLKARRLITGDPKYTAIVDNSDLGAGPGNLPSPSKQLLVEDD